MADPKIERLRRVPLFSQLSREQLAFVASRIDEVEVPAGKTLVTQGSSSYSLHVIVAGTVEVIVDGKTRRTIEPGGFFGEISMFERRNATATVKATGPLQLLIMSLAQFRDAIKGDPELSMAVLASMADRLRADAEARGESDQLV